MFKKLFLGVLLVLVVLAIPVAVRTARFHPAQLEVPPAPHASVDADAAAAHLAKAVTFATISNQDRKLTDTAAFDGLHQFLEATYPNVYRALPHEAVGPAALLFTWKGSDPNLEPLLLLAHQDVVPVEKGSEAKWTVPPFAGAVQDGFVWGRGAIDDKGSLIATLEAVEAMVKRGFQPKRTVLLALGADEEIGGRDGAVKISELLKSRNVKPFMVLDEGQAITHDLIPGVPGDVALVGIAEKGYLSVELAVHAEGGHSSMPPRETAVGILSNALARLEAHPMSARITDISRKQFELLGPHMPLPQQVALANLWLTESLVMRAQMAKPAGNAMMRTTTAPTMLEGSSKENVLPITARAVVNFRILPGDSIEGVLVHVREAVADARVDVNAVGDTRSEPSPEAPVDGPGYRAIEKTIREMYPETIVAPSLVLGATDSRHSQILGGPIYRFGPMHVGPTDLPRIHGTDERVGVKDLGDAIAFYERLIENVDH